MGLFKDCGCGCNGEKQQKRFVTSIISALVFFLVANPEVFKLVRSVAGSWVASPTGCPSMLGLLLHAVVFMLIVWGMMNIKRESMEGGDIMDEAPTAPKPEAGPPPSAPKPMAEPVVHEPPSMMSKVLGMDMSAADAMDSGTYKSCSCSDGSRMVVMN